MNAAPPERVKSAQLLREIESFEKKCQQHSVNSKEVEQIFSMLSDHTEREPVHTAKVTTQSNPQENIKIAKALQALLLTVRGSKAVIEAASSSVPHNKLERVVAGCLERFNKDFKAAMKRVTAKEGAKKT
jgi:hypothetical protein